MKLLSCIMLLPAALQVAGAQPSADLVLVNGNIWTVNAAQPRAEAVACLGGRIVAVGSNDEIRKWAGPATRVVDLAGKLVVPGFNDAHVHFASGGQSLAGVQQRDAKSEAEYRQRMAAFAATQPAGRCHDIRRCDGGARHRCEVATSRNVNRSFM